MLAMRAMPLRVVAMATKTVTKKSAKAPANTGRTLWLPNYESPAWLDGSLPGDAGAEHRDLQHSSSYIAILISTSLVRRKRCPKIPVHPLCHLITQASTR